LVSVDTLDSHRCSSTLWLARACITMRLGIYRRLRNRLFVLAVCGSILPLAIFHDTLASLVHMVMGRKNGKSASRNCPMHQTNTQRPHCGQVPNSVYVERRILLNNGKRSTYKQHTGRTLILHLQLWNHLLICKLNPRIPYSSRMAVVSSNLYMHRLEYIAAD
jgi:hypothetical protein